MVRDLRNALEESVIMGHPNLHSVKVPLWKDHDPVVTIGSAQETGSILKIGFAPSK